MQERSFSPCGLIKLLGAIVLLGSFACQPAADPDALRLEIEEQARRGNREAALRIIERLRDALPDSPESTLEIADRLTLLGDAGRARWMLETASERFPEDDRLKLALASTALRLADPESARTALRSIDPASSAYTEALLLRARAENSLGDADAALVSLEEARWHDPAAPEARLALIEALRRRAEYGDARAALLEARAELDLEADEALGRHFDLLLADLDAAEGRVHEALANLEGILSVDPHEERAWSLRVRLLVQDDRQDEAVALLEEAIAGDGSPGRLTVLLAPLYRAQGRGDEADRLLVSRAASSDAVGDVLWLAQHYAESDDPEAALAAVDTALDRLDGHPALRLRRFDLLLALDRLDAARVEAVEIERASGDDDPLVEYLEARLELAAGKADTAADRLRALAPRLDVASTHFWLGAALESAGDAAGARRRYGMAQRRDPSWLAPSIALLRLAQHRGDWLGAAAHARTIAATAPARIDAWAALVESLERAGHVDGAGEAANACAERLDELRCGVVRARALRVRGETDAALAALGDAAAPADRIEAERILTLGIGGRLEEAVTRARAAGDRFPESARVHAASASVHFALGQEEAAWAAGERALALDPDDPEPLGVRCRYGAAGGDAQRALAACERYLASRPTDARAHFHYAVTLSRLGDRYAAIEAYRRAAELDPRDARPRNNLAELLASAGDLKGALREAQSAYGLAPEDPYVLDSLGVLYLRKGLDRRAIALLEEALRRAPEVPIIRRHLAEAYERAGRGDEARLLLAARDAVGEAPQREGVWSNGSRPIEDPGE